MLPVRNLIFLPLIVLALQSPPQTPFVILVNGQSNAISNPLDGQDCTPYQDPRITTYRGGWHQADCITGSPGFVGVVWMMFAKKVLDRNGRPVIIINEAQSGQPIAHFHPDGANYQRLLNRVTAAKISPNMIVFYQGERDAKLGTNGLDWRNGYKILRDSWRVDYPSVDRFVLIQIQPGCGATPEASQEIMAAQAMIRGAMLIETGDIEQRADRCHLSEAGMVKLANRLNNRIR